MSYNTTFKIYEQSFIWRAQYYYINESETLSIMNFLHDERTYWEEVYAVLSGRIPDRLKSNSDFLVFKTKLLSDASKQGAKWSSRVKTTARRTLDFLKEQIEAHGVNPYSFSSDVVAFKFVNKFDQVDSEKVYFHFYTHLVATKMLTDEELKQFLTDAFVYCRPPESKLTLKGTSIKLKAIKAFRDYYTILVGVRRGNKPKYVDLLANYFSGFPSTTVMTNFTK